MDFYLYFIIGMGCVTFFLILATEYYENKKRNKYKVLKPSKEELETSTEEVKPSTEEITSTEEVKQPNNKSEGETIEKTPVVLAVIIVLSITGFFLYPEKTTPVREYYDNKNPKLLGFYLEKTGKKHGEWSYYEEDGKLDKIEHYKNGKLIKTEKRRYHLGNLSSISFYKDRYKHGEYKMYHDNGNLEQIGSYIYGKEEGPWRYYYDNGELYRTDHYKNGEIIKQEYPE